MSCLATVVCLEVGDYISLLQTRAQRVIRDTPLELDVSNTVFKIVGSFVGSDAGDVEVRYGSVTVLDDRGT